MYNKIYTVLDIFLAKFGPGFYFFFYFFFFSKKLPAMIKTSNAKLGGHEMIINHKTIVVKV